MNRTPSANRIHIAIFGKRNAGKSSLINALTGQEVSLVSEYKGTTTDPVSKAMELIPVGPVVFIDTAGLDDEGDLGLLRVEKTLKVLHKTDFAIYIMDIKDIDIKALNEMKKNFKKFNIPYLVVVNKIDTVEEEELKEAMEKHGDAIFISAKRDINIELLKEELIRRIREDAEEPPLIGDLVPYNGKVILVVPIDSEAPKGRLILPQVQVIRDCLDNGIKSYVVRDTELNSALEDLGDVDLVITDSQAFKTVNEIVPDNIRLTSFSILFSRYKGDLRQFLEGIEALKKLDGSSKVLISESCTHNISCEDIGRVKIPRIIRERINRGIQFDFAGGHDFPDNIKEYDLIIHCGACMNNRKTMETRLMLCREENVPITNYGMVLAYFTGILDRAIEVFNIK